MIHYNPQKKELLHQKNILAIDYGDKVTGLALFRCGSDPFPTIYDRILMQKEDIFKKLHLIIIEEAIDVVLIGLPTYLDGNESMQTKKVKEFKIGLSHFLESKNILLDYFYQDETLSTQTAKDRMLASPEYQFKIDLQKIDALSALIILEDFLAHPDFIK